MITVTFQLEPLTCPSCIKKIEKILSKTAGVDHVIVMFNASKVKVNYDELNLKSRQINYRIRSCN
ncbi:heavy-metal-associated domain-containing protein [Paenibacillus sp. 1001270B_150601_E10]|uniref:heavy-metal-associated domain-containing protein n=1 Tax=Paenibacillus sp. 1001270B_150601_E10 TaxID=2787079 RepID=UPI003B63D29E